MESSVALYSEDEPGLVFKDGLYVFTQQEAADPSPSPENVLDNIPEVELDPPPTSDPTFFFPEREPPEIRALLSAFEIQLPVSVVICRSSTVAAYILPDGCGCAFLGFFFIRGVVATKASALRFSFPTTSLTAFPVACDVRRRSRRAMHQRVN